MNGTIECAFVGRLAGDPEHKVSKAGNVWCRFSVAVGEGDEVQWVSVSCFKEAAARAMERLHKGDRCYIEGNIKLNKWTGQDGIERSGLQVACFKIEPLGQIGRRKPPKPKAQPEGEQPATPPTTAAAARDWQSPPADTMPAGGGRKPFDDNIPFAAEWR